MKKTLRVREDLWLHARLWTSMRLCHTETEPPSLMHGGPGAFEKADGPKEGSERMVAVGGHMHSTKHRPVKHSLIKCYQCARHCAKHLVYIILFVLLYWLRSWCE